MKVIFWIIVGLIAIAGVVGISLVIKPLFESPDIGMAVVLFLCLVWGVNCGRISFDIFESKYL